MSSILDLLRAQLSHVLQKIAENLPANFKMTLVARHTGTLLDADIVLTEDHPLKVAELLTRFQKAALKEAIEKRGPQDAAYLIELREHAQRLLPDGHSFLILVTPFGSGDLLVRHTASCDRESAIRLMRHYADLMEKNPEAFGKHV